MSQPEALPPGTTYYAGSPPDPPSTSSGWFKILGCGGCAVGAVIVISVGLFLLVVAGMELLEEQVEADLRDNAVVLQHLGRIEEFEVDGWASLNAEGEDDFVFHVRGALGSGTLRVTCITIDDETEEVVAGTLQLDSGEIVQLIPAEAEP